MASHRRLAAFLTSLFFAVVPLAARASTAPDVLVVGGTPAGVAAAIAAARDGADVTLVARGSVLGGILTDGMMDQWDINVGPTGNAIQGGLFREIHARLGDSFTPQAAASVFADLIAREPRITVRTGLTLEAVDTAASAPDSRRVERVRFTDTRNHVETITADAVIDATDNGDLAALAGARYDLGRQDTGRDERTQAVTLMFALRGVDWLRLASSYENARYGPGGATERRAWGYSATLADYVPLSRDILVRDLNLGRESTGSVTVNAIDVLGIDGLKREDLARARSLTEREAPHLVDFLRTRLPGFENASVDRFARAIYVRETRHFAGLERLRESDVWNGRVPFDAIGLSSYPMDLHPTTHDEKLAYAPLRHVYGVPFGALVPRGFSNLLLASPSISATHIAAGSARVIPTTIEEGEAAGTACAIALRGHLSFSEFVTDPRAFLSLRDDLLIHGVLLPEIAESDHGARPSSGTTRA